MEVLTEATQIVESKISKLGNLSKNKLQSFLAEFPTAAEKIIVYSDSVAAIIWGQ